MTPRRWSVMGAMKRLVELIRELNYWQRRAAILSMAPDRYLPHPDRAPESFSEFLARTSGPLLREPSFKARLAGRQVG
ncbi:MAG TPA: hypothetical protein VFW16_13530 [Streptosporangiaceae bacterium]|nr:hypothetical protein [Streptosporangiaceae bacterium]